MKEIAIICAWLTSREKENTLIENIQRWKEHNIPVMISSQYIINSEIQKLVDYYLYDSEQYMDNRLKVQRVITYEDLTFTSNYPRPNHAAGVMAAYSHALKVVGSKYDICYLLNYDAMLRVDLLSNFVRAKEQDKYNLFLFPWCDFDDAHGTHVIISRNNGFNKVWGRMETTEDYLQQTLSTKSKNNMVEWLIKELVELKGLQNETYLFNKDEEDLFLEEMDRHKTDADLLRVIVNLASTTTGGAILFIINELENKPIQYKITETSIPSCNVQIHEGEIIGNRHYVWRAFGPSTHLVVETSYAFAKRKEYLILANSKFNECFFTFNDKRFECKYPI